MFNKYLYANGLTNVFLGNVDFANDDIKLALFTNTYVPAKLTDNLFSGLSGEASGAGYTAGGKLLQGVSVDDYEYGQGFSMLVTAVSVNWSGLTLSFRYGVLYDATSGCLLALLDFTGATITLSGQTFGVEFPDDIIMSAYIT